MLWRTCIHNPDLFLKNILKSDQQYILHSSIGTLIIYEGLFVLDSGGKTTTTNLQMQLLFPSASGCLSSQHAAVTAKAPLLCTTKQMNTVVVAASILLSSDPDLHVFFKSSQALPLLALPHNV